MLTFEQTQIMGVNNILEKLTSVGPMRHEPKTVDYQPTVNNGVIAFVSGDIYLGEHPIKFSQVFHLQPGGPANYFVYNDIFQLNYG